MTQKTIDFVETNLAVLRLNVGRKNWLDAAGQFTYAMGGVHALSQHGVMSQSEADEVERRLAAVWRGDRAELPL